MALFDFRKYYCCYHCKEKLMATLQEALDAVRACNDKADSLIIVVTNLAEQIKAIPALTAEQQAAVDAIFAEAQAQSSELAAAIDANTPAQPPVAPVV